MIKNAIQILILFSLLASCNSTDRIQNNQTEKVGYDLINNYFVRDIAEYEKQIFFYNKQLIKIEFPNELLDKSYYLDNNDFQIDEYPLDFDKNIEPPETIDINEWDEKRLNQIKIFDDSTPKKYLENGSLFNVSFPSMSKNGLYAIIEARKIDQDYTADTRIYIYKREKNQWESLKEYGTENIYLTLEKYFRLNK